MNSTTIEISDVFLRRYGHVGALRRDILSAHYDVTSYVTAVIALDDAALDGKNGLYTVLEDEEKNTGTSNHAALRRYFLLSTGDGVVHT
eukprot:902875-Ditylum_brightwellii.AAC.1